MLLPSLRNRRQLLSTAKGRVNFLQENDYWSVDHAPLDGTTPRFIQAVIIGPLEF